MFLFKFFLYNINGLLPINFNISLQNVNILYQFYLKMQSYNVQKIKIVIKKIKFYYNIKQLLKHKIIIKYSGINQLIVISKMNP